jgi:outer membrane protein OmpA-like peptidoglycan-associated protein
MRYLLHVAALGACASLGCAAAVDDREATQATAPRQVVPGRPLLEPERREHADAGPSEASGLASLRQLAASRQGEHDTVVTLAGPVWFTTGSSVLRPGARLRLAEVATMLGNHRDGDLVVLGYVDSRESPLHQQALSLSRAQGVRDYLVTSGVPAARIHAEGRGAGHPTAPGPTTGGRASDRRVEIVMRPRVAVAAGPR